MSNINPAWMTDTVRVLTHYTLNTGHTRASPRSEVGKGVADACRPLLEVGEHAMPNDARYTLCVPLTNHGWAGTVRLGADRPLVTFAIADSEDAANGIWPHLEKLYLIITDKSPFAGANFRAPKRPDSLPWCAAITILPDEAMHWIGDFERCMAWTWLERKKS
jgi:hypothetical protein